MAIASAAGYRRLLLVFFVIYWVQKLSNNFQGLAKVPLRIQLQAPRVASGLELDPAAAGAFLTAAALGWYIKPLFGMITDRLPLFGYRRKSWLVLGSLLTSAAWLSVAVGAGGSVAALFAAVLTINVLISFCDVVCDGLMVESGQAMERTRRLPPGTGNRPLQTAQWLGSGIALLLAAVGGGVIAQFFDLRLAAIVCGILPLLVVAVVVPFVHEERRPWDGEKARRGFLALGLAMVVAALVLALQRLPSASPLAPWVPFLSPAIVLAAVLAVAEFPRAIVVPAFLILFWTSTPFGTDSQYFYSYVTRDNPDILAALQTDRTVVPAIRGVLVRLGVASVGEAAQSGFPNVFYGSVLLSLEQLFGIAGLLLLLALFRRAPLGRTLTWCVAGWMLMLGLYAALAFGLASSPLYLILCCGLGGAVIMIANTGMLFFAAGRTPPADQATAFALLTGLSNLGSMFGVETLGGWGYTRVQNAPAVVLPALTGANRGLLAVLLLSLAHAALFLAALRWLMRRGMIDTRTDEQAPGPARLPRE